MKQAQHFSIPSWSSLSLAQKALLLLSGLALAVGIWARIYNLGFPAKQVFDEVYFPVFANNYLNGVSFFDVHPPLGKFIIAGSIALFGDTPFAWRFMQSVLGIGIIFLGAATWWEWTKEKIGSLLFATFLAVETMLIVYSRIGLMDGIQFFFILAVLWAAVRAKRGTDIWWVAILLGLAVSIKWVALAVLIPVAYILWRKKLLKTFVPSLLLSLAIYVLIVYIGQILNGVENPLAGVWEWHRQAYGYHLHLTATHPWSSMWWSWPLMLRPVLFFYELDASQRVMAISAIGNPVLWLSATVAVAASVIELGAQAFLNRHTALKHPLLPLLLGYGASLLPWIPIHRVVFIYHYLPAYLFALLMLVYWMTRIWRKYPWIVVAFVLIIIVIGFFYLPMAMGLPLPNEALQQRLWLKSWL